MTDVLKHFPSFELSYEMISHKKVDPEYSTCFAIPYGKKAFLWMTFIQDTDVCLLLELGRERKVSRIQCLAKSIPTSLAYGTLFYGTICSNQDQNHFVIEDFLYYSGIPLYKLPFSEKGGFLRLFFEQWTTPLSLDKNTPIHISLPLFWNIEESAPKEHEIPYTIHHFQYRCLTKIMPFINVKPQKETTTITTPSLSIPPLPMNTEVAYVKPNFSKPQYKEAAIFEVKANMQSDVYHLYAYKNAEYPREFYGVAYVPNYKTSVWLNSLFRNIKENWNLDAIEESDDEADFEDIRVDKYVDLNKRILIECIFNNKFKRWIPNKVVKGTPRIVQLHRLV